jgi:hypothetical protein
MFEIPAPIKNEQLAIPDIPGPRANWETVEKFALTFDGYETLGSFEAVADVANAHKDDTSTDLRTCLFFEQRRWRHFGYKPDRAAMKYIRGVIEQIRAKVVAGQRS